MEIGDARLGPRSAWQPPQGGISEEVRKRFFSHILMSVHPGHWIWNGVMNNTKPALMVDERLVGAQRISFALAHPGGPIPKQLRRKCEHHRCVKPDCLESVGSPEEPKAEVPLKEKKFYPAPTLPDPGGGVPRVIEAMAALQFGTPVTPRPLRKLLVTEDRIETPEGPVVVKAPVGTVAYTPPPASKALPLTLQEVLDAVFAPNTIVMTFPTGHVWISTPGARIDAADGVAAIMGALTMQGKRSVKG